MPRLYSVEHVWLDASTPDAATVGITAHAQEALGDVVFTDLPAPGTALAAGQVAGVIESVKAAADFICPRQRGSPGDQSRRASRPQLAQHRPPGRGLAVYRAPDGPRTA